MPEAAKVGESIAGGVIIGPGAPTVLVEGQPISVVEDSVAPHGIGLHASAKVIVGSTTVMAEGKPVVRQGDLATCGHPVANGSPTVIVG